VPGASHSGVQIGDLLALTGRIVGERPARRAFGEQAEARGETLAAHAPADRHWVQFTERMLAAAIGSSSARLVLTRALKGSGMDVAEVVAVLDEAGQEMRFNREILSSTLENLGQGVSVVDHDMRLVSWNRRYQEMFEYPDGMLYVGRPVADLIRYNAERGELGSGEAVEHDVQAQIDKRISYMRAGSPHVFERVRASGQVIEMRGQPLPGGGYVTSYSDVTDYKRAEAALREVNETLEQRVATRTREATDAQQSRTRFLAALSHDVLQPLNAAHLSVSALAEVQTSEEGRKLVRQVERSLETMGDLLRTLLDISKLDAGVVQPEISDVSLETLFSALRSDFQPLAGMKGLQLKFRPTATVVRSDRTLLRRILQNILSNALRYTASGGVLIGVRRRGAMVRIDVADTGCGIPQDQSETVFEEFHRAATGNDAGFDGGGLGLGLAIVRRIAGALGHGVTFSSRVGRGTVFHIDVPAAIGASPPSAPPALEMERAPGYGLFGSKVLLVENDADVRDAMASLLERWQCQVRAAATTDEALDALGDTAWIPDVVIADQHLDQGDLGTNTIAQVRDYLGRPVPGLVVTADPSDAIAAATRAAGIELMRKPLKPAQLRALLAHLLA
jgi:signal transduction histidine kinase